MEFPVDLKDRNGIKVAEHDVIFDGNHHFKIVWDDQKKEVYAYSCTHGSIRNVSQQILKDFDRIGTYDEKSHLFECD